jgi:hypothetical protein
VFCSSCFRSLLSMVRSCSQPEMIAFNPIVRMRQSRALYPLRRSPFRYPSRTRRSDPPSISLRTILTGHDRSGCCSKIGLGSGFNDHTRLQYQLSSLPQSDYSLIWTKMCRMLCRPKIEHAVRLGLDARRIHSRQGCQRYRRVASPLIG